jgi:Flp pilus assembly protein TadD
MSVFGPRLLAIALTLAAWPAAADFWDPHDGARCADAVAEARGQLQRNAFATVITLMQEAVRRCPEDGAALSLLGAALVENGQPRSGRAALERARELLPESSDPVLAFHLGFARALDNDFAGAVIEYRRSARGGGLSGRERWLVDYDLADALSVLGRLTEAIEAYRRATRAAPEAVVPHLALAVALDRDGQEAASRAEVAAALSLDRRLRDLGSDRYLFQPPEDIHYYWALVHLCRHELESARTEFTAYLSAAPLGPYARRAQAHLVRLPASNP